MNSSSSCARAAETPPCACLESLFDGLFARSEHTLLRGGAHEPLYAPARGATTPAVIRYRHDYAASALHEVAHWCIAGSERRRYIDYGYWYAPDGRSPAQQREFMRVEARPQALEWYFSRACGLAFHVSLDNLDAPPDPETYEEFTARIVASARQLALEGLPPRAARFHAALCAEFASAGYDGAAAVFSADELR